MALPAESMISVASIVRPDTSASGFFSKYDSFAVTVTPSTSTASCSRLTDISVPRPGLMVTFGRTSALYPIMEKRML